MTTYTFRQRADAVETLIRSHAQTLRGVKPADVDQAVIDARVALTEGHTAHRALNLAVEALDEWHVAFETVDKWYREVIDPQLEALASQALGADDATVTVHSNAYGTLRHWHWRRLVERARQYHLPDGFHAGRFCRWFLDVAGIGVDFKTVLFEACDAWAEQGHYELRGQFTLDGRPAVYTQ